MPIEDTQPPEDTGSILAPVDVIELEVGPPIHPFTSEMLERLKRLETPDATYQPDAAENGEALLTALNLRAAVLLVEYWLGYEDDWPETHREVASLLARFDAAGLEAIYTVPRIRSLSARLAEQLAYERGDYVGALLSGAYALYALCKACLDKFDEDGYLDGSRGPIAAPWLDGARDRSLAYIEHIERQPRQAVQWGLVAEACAVLREVYGAVGFFDELIPDSDWSERKGWAESQLTPDQLRDYLQASEDERAAQRLQAYFFHDGLWEMLPERAREALVSADRTMVSATHGRRAGILNEIRIATEEVLHRYLWVPLSQWASEQRGLHPGVSAILGGPEQQRRSPGIDDYVQLLWHSGAGDYFRSVGLSDDDIRFLTKENRTTKHLQALQRTRNRAEHEPDSGISRSEIRDLYAESLGIGRKGILPELLRLLARRGASG